MIPQVRKEKAMHKLPDFAHPGNRIYALTLLEHGGVCVISPQRVYAERSVKVGEGTVLYPDVYLFGKTRIGKNCVIHAGVHIINSSIGDNCVIGPGAYVRNSTIRHDVTIAHGEVNRSYIGPRTLIKHFSYIGDAKILRDCNIGAGVVFCNYNGLTKHKIEVRESVFIGSGTMLVAPLTLGAECYIAAGSVVTKDIPPNALVIARGPIEAIKKNHVTRDKDGWHFHNKYM